MISIKFIWSCNVCSGGGKCYLPRHKAIRSARSHSRKKNEEFIDITLKSFEDKVELYKEFLGGK